MWLIHQVLCSIVCSVHIPPCPLAVNDTETNNKTIRSRTIILALLCLASPSLIWPAHGGHTFCCSTNIQWFRWRNVLIKPHEPLEILSLTFPAFSWSSIPLFDLMMAAASPEWNGCGGCRRPNLWSHSTCSFPTASS